MPNVTEITNLDQVPNTGLVVIDFYADWCGPCKKLSPYYNDFSDQFPSIKFLKVNSDDADELSKHYEVSALPTILFIKNGDVLSIIRGFNPDKMLEELNDLQKI